jgi:hypothetical protein
MTKECAVEYPVIDHLVMAASSLDEGTNYILKILNVRPQAGGEHELMGTHNRVVRLGEGCYLEVIAINQRAQKPEHPRWFELDTHAMQEKLRQKPRLITWAIRTDRIEELSQRCLCPLGNIRPMNRGNLYWRLTLTEDGHLPERGLVPFLIQWDKTPHPAALMQKSGCGLVKLYGYHSQPEAITHILEFVGAEKLIEIKQLESGSSPYLTAVIDTPAGLKMLT